MEFKTKKISDSEVESEATIYAELVTQYWDQKVLDEYNISHAFVLHIIPDSADDDIDTVDVTTFPYENAFVFNSDATEKQRDDAHNELSHEGLERYDVVMRHTLESADSRFIARDSVEFDPSWTDIEEAWHEARANGINEPSILNPDTLDSYIKEKQAARRALNIPPIANWGANGLDNLPLFVHAANTLARDLSSALDRLKRVHGECASFKAYKERVKKEGLSWDLPSAEAFRASR